MSAARQQYPAATVLPVGKVGEIVALHERGQSAWIESSNAERPEMTRLRALWAAIELEDRQRRERLP